MRNIPRVVALVLVTMFLTTQCYVVKVAMEPTEDIDIPKTAEVALSSPTYEPIEQTETIEQAGIEVVKEVPFEEPKPVTEPDPEPITMSQEDIELIALVTMAEAEGESEFGKRLVIDAILNRVDHEKFPNTVHDVIYAPNQFTSMWNGRADRCYVREDICELVKEELVHRTNDDVVFFNANGFPSYGEPVAIVGNHYFLSYD